jgi:hypothetical protein
MGLKKRGHWLVLPGIALLLALLPSPVSAATTVTLVASGFDSPRGIASIDGKWIVSEAGHPSGTCVAPPGAPPGVQLCVGTSSRISWVNTETGGPTPLASGFLSFSAAEETLGLSGLSVRDGQIYAQIAVTSREVLQFLPGVAIGSQAGKLIKVNPGDGSWTTVASVGDFDFDYTASNFTPPNPSCMPTNCQGRQETDANPNDVLATSHGYYVADAGANTLTKVSANGDLKVLAYFPWRPSSPNVFPTDEVPTCVTGGNDGLWIGTLSGHLYRFEEGKVTQVTPRDSSGNALLSHVTGCTSRGDNTLVLVNMFGQGQRSDATFVNGSVVRYNTETGKGSVLADAFHDPLLFLPYMAKFGRDGNLYVTSGAICPTDGANPFQGAPFNPCTIGNAKGGRVVQLTLTHGDEGD